MCFKFREKATSPHKVVTNFKMHPFLSVPQAKVSWLTSWTTMLLAHSHGSMHECNIGLCHLFES